MYCPPAFAEDRRDVMAALIGRWPLGLLISAGAGMPVANPVPFQLTPDGRHLRAHLARANPQLADLRAAGQALIVFQGEQAYISPGWYATKRDSGKVVPTWNYLMVQVQGRVQLTDDAGWLRDQIDALTTRMEAAQPDPWAVADAPETFVAAQLRGIIGLEIEIETMRGKWKAGQNRTAADRAGVAQALAPTHPALASAATGEA